MSCSTADAAYSAPKLETRVPRMEREGGLEEPLDSTCLKEGVTCGRNSTTKEYK